MTLRMNDFIYIFFGTLLLFLFSSTQWLETYFINVKPSIYIIFFSFILLNVVNLFNYLIFLLKENFKNLDFLIIISIFLFFIIQENVNFYAISFLSLYFFINSLYKYTIESKADIIELVINCILLSGLFAVSGIYFGLIESLYFETSIFHTLRPLGYPNPTSDVIRSITGLNLSNHISGFQTSINYSAYIIISCLGVLNLSRCKAGTILTLKIIMLAALFLTQAKVGFLYISILLSLKIFVNSHQNLKLIVISSLCFGYLFLTHFTMIESSAEILYPKYYREFAFNFFNFDFYLSLFSWLKLNSFNYLTSTSFFIPEFNALINFDEHEPHSLFFSSIFIGGLFFAIILSIKLFSILFSFFFNSNNKEIYFSAALYSFIIESLIWDSYDAPIFWLIVLMGHYYQFIFTKRLKGINEP